MAKFVPVRLFKILSKRDRNLKTLTALYKETSYSIVGVFLFLRDFIQFTRYELQEQQINEWVCLL